MTAARTALVIGGGIAGPVLAMALRKAGIEAAVYEAYPTSADGVGGTLTVAPNGLDALRIVGADRDVRAVGAAHRSDVMADGRGRELVAFPGLRGLEPSPGAVAARPLPRAARPRRRRRRRDRARPAPGRRRRGGGRRHRAVRRRHDRHGRRPRRRGRHPLDRPDADRPRRARPAPRAAPQRRRPRRRRAARAARRGPLRLRPARVPRLVARPRRRDRLVRERPRPRPDDRRARPGGRPVGVARAARRRCSRASDPAAELVARTAPDGLLRARVGRDDAAGAAVVAWPDGPRRRRGARAVAELGPGRVAGDRERGGARALPARRPRPRDARSPPTSACAGPGWSGSRTGGEDEPDEGVRPGRDPGHGPLPCPSRSGPSSRPSGCSARCSATGSTGTHRSGRKDGARGRPRPAAARGSRPARALRVVVDVERRRALRERQPPELRPREDMDVRRDARGSSRVPPRTKRHRGRLYSLNTATWHSGSGGSAARSRRREARRPAAAPREDLHAVGLDEQVDDEGAPGLPLAVQAVAAVDEHRLGRQPVAERPARARRRHVRRSCGRMLRGVLVLPRARPTTDLIPCPPAPAARVTPGSEVSASSKRAIASRYRNGPQLTRATPTCRCAVARRGVAP